MNEKIEWRQLTANERDALIAEHVFGRKIVKWKEDRALLMERVGIVGHEAMPPYSTSMDAAWQIVEFEGFSSAEVSRRWLGLGDTSKIANKYICSIVIKGLRVSRFGETPQDAICLAALKAIGVKVV